MTDLLQPISVTPSGLEVPLSFTSTAEVERWIAAEAPFWSTFPIEGLTPSLARLITGQRRFFDLAHRHCAAFRKAIKPDESKDEAKSALAQANQQLNQLLRQVADERVITSSHRAYPIIAQLATKNPQLAAIVLAASLAQSRDQLGESGPLRVPNAALIELFLTARPENSADWLQPKRAELESLTADCRALAEQTRAALAAHSTDILNQNLEATALQQEREGDWALYKQSILNEWETLKKVYDEQLALLAPTQYWTARAKTHRWVAGTFAVAYGVILALAVAAFLWIGWPHLSALSTKKDVSTLLALIPLAIPAFAAVWVLRMLSRLLSENLQMMRDARERETMVKTFLALMRDDSAGKALVKDEDRIMILHSLFRPSSISSVDDSPPVHWFDILTNRTGGISK